MARYRFGEFVLSPRRRLLIRGGRELPLIPRYFDLLVFLVEHRHEAVHRRDIFDRVWSDVVVSESALSQAVRTIRRTLGDDSREPRFIRTVSRHGYRFVWEPMLEEPDEDAVLVTNGAGAAGIADGGDPFEPLLARLTNDGGAVPEEEQFDAAEQLHALGTREALRRLGVRPGHERARALLRAARWALPGAWHVPLAGQPGALTSAVVLARLRLRRAARPIAGRWAGASLGAAFAGIVAGASGGLLLAAAPESPAPVAVAVVLAALGGLAGAAAGAGVGAGLAMAEAAVRSRRTAALVAGGAAGGGAVGWCVEWLSRWSLSTIVGLDVRVGGGIEGIAIGAAAGLGFALATRRAEGLAAPRGARRLSVAAATALACGAAGLVLTLAGRPLIGGTIHAVTQATHGGRALLTPLGRMLGEPDFGPITRAIIGTGESALFGFGLALGLTRRP